MLTLLQIFNPIFNPQTGYKINLRKFINETRVKGAYPNYPEGKKDDTHLNDFGASTIAELISGEIKKQHIPLAKRVK